MTRDMKCHTKDELCEMEKCRNWIECIELGNCVLRVDREYTLEEIGMMVGGITRERVRQIEEKALRKIKKLIIDGVGDGSIDLPWNFKAIPASK